MPRIECHRKIRTAADLIGGIATCIETIPISCADFRDEIAARRKTQHPDFPRIDMPFGSVVSNQAHRSLCILESQRRCRAIVRAALAVPVIWKARYAVAQQHAGDSL